MATKQLTLEINLDELVLEDLEVLDMSKTEKLPGGQTRSVTSMHTILDTLDRIVVGGVRGKGYKGTQLMQILEQVQTAIFSEMDTLHLQVLTGQPLDDLTTGIPTSIIDENNLIDPIILFHCFLNFRDECLQISFFVIDGNNNGYINGLA